MHIEVKRIDETTIQLREVGAPITALRLTIAGALRVELGLMIEALKPGESVKVDV